MAGFKSQPNWWFGAPLFGVLFGFVANRFAPEFVDSSAALIFRLSGNGHASAISSDTRRLLAPLVGMVLAVLVLAAWQLVKSTRRKAAPL
jgi:uncharacterized membrane protein YccC